MGLPHAQLCGFAGNLPQRLFVHGDVPAYSNYSYALAGYLVERASEQRFEDYAANNILRPLGHGALGRRRAAARTVGGIRSTRLYAAWWAAAAVLRDDAAGSRRKERQRSLHGPVHDRASAA